MVARESAPEAPRGVSSTETPRPNVRVAPEGGQRSSMHSRRPAILPAVANLSLRSSRVAGGLCVAMDGGGLMFIWTSSGKSDSFANRYLSATGSRRARSRDSRVRVIPTRHRDAVLLARPCFGNLFWCLRTSQHAAWAGNKHAGQTAGGIRAYGQSLAFQRLPAGRAFHYTLSWIRSNCRTMSSIARAIMSG